MQNDNEIIKEWQMMLKMFKDIDHTKSDSKSEYEELKELAQLSGLLTPRQKEGIYARCNNAIGGTYLFPKVD